jgi:hypothetical protein
MIDGATVSGQSIYATVLFNGSRKYVSLLVEEEHCTGDRANDYAGTAGGQRSAGEMRASGSRWSARKHSCVA